ncbi:hypothetical protein WJX84_001771 [Apatococcus fuscideae]|uniref:Glycosyltransferase family 28 N-terminal domain-containing protein n=1 Tax=Apatococcus fuscideae TaxID=2026836 RepID=A0AAW1SYI8_9CHLO
MTQGLWGPGGDVVANNPLQQQTLHHSLDHVSGVASPLDTESKVMGAAQTAADLPYQMSAQYETEGEGDNEDDEQSPSTTRGPIHMTYTLNHQGDEEPTAKLAAAEATSVQHAGQAADVLDAAPVQTSGDSFTQRIPPLSIVMLVVGTRGDVQPFIALGLELQKYGHRIRLATHLVYRAFVEGFDLEYYPLGGDPTVLSEYVVRNRGVMPFHNVKDVGEQRKQLRDIIFSCWPACSAPDPEHPDVPFMAEAIIANPVSYAHFHCADKLKVPLHLYFPFPWSPTKAFPHPMARILYRGVIPEHIMNSAKRQSYFQSIDDAKALSEQMHETGLKERVGRRLGDVHRMGQGVVVHQMGIANKLSYMALDDIMFPGVDDILQEFRSTQLGLDGLRGRLHSVHLTAVSRVPFTYCWSQSVVPKPEDWGDNIDVCGYFFLDLASRFEPPQDLLDFLQEGPAPIYFGFGSMIMDNPHKLSKTIFEALKVVGKRAIIQRGWGKLGEVPGLPVPKNVYLIDSAPHDWLFKQCSGVVHHGGAGTVAAGLIANCPTLVVPFFGDQPFWGEACQAGNLGPKPIPIDHFTKRRLIKALERMDDPEVRAAVTAVGKCIRSENGAAAGAHCFHRHLPFNYMQGKAEGQTRPHQPGAPMDHSAASSAKPLEPFRRLILRSHLPGAPSRYDAGPSSPPSSLEADRRSSQGSLEGQPSGSVSEPGGGRWDRGSSRIGVGEWLRGHLKPGQGAPEGGRMGHATSMPEATDSPHSSGLPPGE